MHLSSLFPPLLLSLILPISAVDITLSLTPPNPMDVPDVQNNAPTVANNPANPFGGGNIVAAFGTTYQRCTNQPAGVCCRPRPPPANIPPAMAAMFSGPRYRRVTMTGLLHTDLGIAWVPRGQALGCYGTPKETHWGGGDWVYDIPQGDADEKLSGANYIKMPTNLPAEGSQSPWMEAEGILGMVWGRGQWWAGDSGTAAAQTARANLLAEASKALQGPFPFRRRKGRRNWDANIRSENKGVVFCKEPDKATWADTIVVNGTEYVAQGAGSVIYKTAGGEVLDFTGTANSTDFAN